MKLFGMKSIALRKAIYVTRMGIFILGLIGLFTQGMDLTGHGAFAQELANDGYRLGTGDKIRVIVFGEQELSGDYEVDSSGYLRLPLIGQVQAAGYSLREFEDAIKIKLEEGYLKDPRVSVEVVNYRPFYIIGEVASPGQYPYVNGMTVLNAVALAGGFTYRARKSTVYIRNGNEEDETPADQTTKIRPGDIIRVGERFF